MFSHIVTSSAVHSTTFKCSLPNYVFLFGEYMIPSSCCLAFVSCILLLSNQTLIVVSHHGSRSCFSFSQLSILLSWSRKVLLFSQLALHPCCILRCFVSVLLSWCILLFITPHESLFVLFFNSVTSINIFNDQLINMNYAQVLYVCAFLAVWSYMSVALGTRSWRAWRDALQVGSSHFRPPCEV